MAGSRLQPIVSLYRSYLRQVRLLPHLYLRQFFEIRARDDVQAILETPNESLRERKLKSVSKRIQRIEKANNKDWKSFQRILNLAYGRTGKLRWELLEPILFDPNSPLPEPIIRNVERSRPPVYSPELKKLFMTPSPKLKKPWHPNDFVTPRTIPSRADPSSDDAALFGPFSKRREVNIQWRWYTSELKKILPPLEVEVNGSACLKTIEEIRAEGQKLLRPLGLQGCAVVQDAENVVGRTLLTRPPLTRRERRTSSADILLPSIPPSQHPSRWVRRRYRALLASIPQLIYEPERKDKNPFEVNTSPLSMSSSYRNTNIPEVDPDTIAWIGQPETPKNTKTTKTTRKA